MALSALAVAAQFSLVEAVGHRPAFLGVFSAGLGGGSIVASLVSSRVLRRTGEEWLAMFGPQAPLQALGSLAIRYVSYRQLYVVTAALALLCAAVLLRPAWTSRSGRISAAGRVSPEAESR